MTKVDVGGVMKCNSGEGSTEVTRLGKKLRAGLVFLSSKGRYNGHQGKPKIKWKCCLGSLVEVILSLGSLGSKEMLSTSLSTWKNWKRKQCLALLKE